MKVQINDGGRSNYFKGTAGDCVTRAIAIATGKDYKEVYDYIAEQNSKQRATKNSRKLGKSARNGVYTKRKWFKDYMKDLGFEWIPTMQIGQGCTVHLKEGEVPSSGRLVVNLSKHACAVIDGVVHDTHDPTRNGTRCVYGYWKLKR